MGLIFSASEIIDRSYGLTFDDVLLVPNHSAISSRRTPVLAGQATRKCKLDIPIISANMDTITGDDMACAMAKFGGMGILHRFMSVDDQVGQVKNIVAYQKENGIKTPITASIGVNENATERVGKLVDAGVEILTIDIAHGDSVMMFETLDYVKKNYPQIEVIAGNTATPDGVRGLIEHGADAVKVGIGPGSMCTTRIITGCGVPQLTAISLCSMEASKYGVPVIADGGMRTSGDIVKAFCAGASSVMLGSMLSGCLETPGKIKGGMKKYRGMASKDAQVSWRGELPKGMAAEGEATMVACKGSVCNVLDEICGGIRSGMTYINAMTIGDLNRNARFIEMSSSGMIESHSHGVCK